jgi:hypothetical protein
MCPPRILIFMLLAGRGAEASELSGAPGLCLEPGFPEPSTAATTAYSRAVQAFPEFDLLLNCP